MELFKALGHSFLNPSLCGSSLWFKHNVVLYLMSDNPSPEKQISIVNIDLPKRVGIRKLSSAIRVSHYLAYDNKLSSLIEWLSPYSHSGRQ